MALSVWSLDPIPLWRESSQRRRLKPLYRIIGSMLQAFAHSVMVNVRLFAAILLSQIVTTLMLRRTLILIHLSLVSFTKFLSLFKHDPDHMQLLSAVVIWSPLYSHLVLEVYLSYLDLRQIMCCWKWSSCSQLLPSRCIQDIQSLPLFVELVGQSVEDST